MPFKPGVSGNPKGRTPLSNSRAAVRESLRKDVPAILKKLTSMARAGDVQAARILLDRVLPAVKPEALAVNLPSVAEAKDSTEQAALVIKAIAMGELAPDVGAQLLGGLGQMARVTEVDRLAKEIEELRQEIRRHKQ
jgi:HAMP domain-containing protein